MSEVEREVLMRGCGLCTSKYLGFILFLGLQQNYQAASGPRPPFHFMVLVLEILMPSVIETSV